jgi:hypothetical protein
MLRHEDESGFAEEAEAERRSRHVVLMAALELAVVSAE